MYTTLLLQFNTALKDPKMRLSKVRAASCELRVTSIMLISNNIGFNFNPGLTLTYSFEAPN